MDYNRAIVLGRLTRDPENKVLPSGNQVTSFSIATDRYYTNKEGEKKQETEFHNITSFGRLAEIAAQYLNKGSLVLIEGRLRTRSWEDESGSKRYRTEIIASSLQLGPKNSNQGGGKQRAAQTKPKGKKKPKQAKAKKAAQKEEDIPVIDEEEIDIDDIPF